MPQQDQVQRVLEPVPGEEVIREDDGVSPLMPFPTDYVLTREQEEELVGHAMKRLGDLEQEMGRDITKGGEWWNFEGIALPDPEGKDGPQATWMGKRILYDKTFRNEVEWRPRLVGGIFGESNLVVPAARRICRQMVARAINYFFGTDPWFAVYPVGNADMIRADQSDRYLRWKMDQAKLKRTEEQAVERAFILGEAVVKTTWRNKEQIYKTTATVLVDEAGNDILDAQGDYIVEADEWIAETVVDEMTGQPIESGLMVLKRDGITPMPQVPIWQEKRITRRIITYRGPEAKVINYLDFLCPLDAETVQDADCVVHLYDRPFMELADEWQKAIAQNSTPDQRLEATRKSVELLRRLAGTSNTTAAGQNSDQVDSATKAGLTNERQQPMVKIAEFHLRYDIDGDGILEDIMLVIDRESRTPIFYDYVANVTPDGCRPFAVVRVNEIPGRWYGMGAMEMMNPSQQVIDLWMNRKNRAVSGSGRVDFWRPHNTVEGRANPNLEMNWGGTYTPIGDKEAKDILESVYIEDNIGDKLMEFIEFYMQLMMNESGVMNANDGQAAGLESSKLATGIRNIEKSGQELFSLFLGHLEPGVSETLNRMVKLVMTRLDEMEVYRYFEEGEEGGEGVQGFQEINPADINNMEIDTRVLLERHRGEQILESSLRATQLVKDFYAQPFEVQVVTADMYRGMLKALQVKNADRVIQPIQMLPVQPGGPDAQGTAAAAASKPRQAPANL
jgi:hypothetical protein